jgi:hypothetical protein
MGNTDRRERLMNDEQRERYRTEAERGDLRPQFNPHAPAALAGVGPLHGIEPVLLDRFSQLRRPIADASQGPEPDMRLSDIASFLYLVETLQRLNYPNVEEMLCILLDQFSPYEEHSYDELHLWCIVQLSRTDGKYVRRFWPEVFSLDAHFRNGDWRHDPECHLIDQPYRLTDLVFYYYDLCTRAPRPRWPSVGSHLSGLWPDLNVEQQATVRRAVQRLRGFSPKYAVMYGDISIWLNAIALPGKKPKG